MHRNVRNHNERGREHRKADDIIPQRRIIESERAEDGGAGDFDIQAVFVVDEGEVADFVYDEAFEAVVEDGELCKWSMRRADDERGNWVKLTACSHSAASGMAS